MRSMHVFANLETQLVSLVIPVHEGHLTASMTVEEARGFREAVDNAIMQIEVAKIQKEKGE